ncbi:MAG: hydroxyphenylacetyl-CoA thioesterase PaaI [Burkholderiales bacterium]|jgi:acyl-CoA thioesterase|nr:hydroxyphenylacetyl-CoA thioesterase PaaI [Burkholderiales bacterium]
MTDIADAVSADAAQALAEAVGREMLAVDAASSGLGMRIVAIGPGFATLSMDVRDDMLNGFRICHGGYLTTLADSAFAFACNSRNALTVASSIGVDFVAPARAGDTLIAEAREVSLKGRTGVYDVTVRNAAGDTVAVLRGRSYRLQDRKVIAR